MQRNFFFFTLFATSLFAAPMPPMSMGDNQKIGVQNSILAKVNGTTISMMDVKKKMDLLFHQNYPHLLHANQARFQFYEASWRHVLMEMIDNELLLADAADKEIKLADAEVREEIENRFGPNVMTMLDKIGLTYDEAWKLIKNDMIVKRMTWWFIHSKALSKVTPQDIKVAYQHKLKETPPYVEWTYRVITLKGEQPAVAAEELYQKIEAASPAPDQLTAILKEFEATHSGVSASLSNEYVGKDIEISETHRAALSSLQPAQYSKPLTQTRRDNSETCRIFYLSHAVDHPAPAFEELAPILKNELIQKASGEISQNYIEKLRKHYRFDASHLKETLPDDLQPFAIQ